MSEPNANSRPSDSMFGLPIRVEPILTGSKWAIVVKGKFIALSPAMNDLICHASAEDLQSLGEKIKAVTVTPTTFIYNGGEEAGFVVGFRNYPRFPTDAYTLRATADRLADALRAELGQRSYMSVDAGGMTTWSTYDA